MKKLIVAAAALAFASVASAGSYHVGKYLFCYDCHSMHGSQSHQYGSANTLAGTPQLFGDWQFAQNTVYEYLLKGGESDSCKSCHDNQTFAPDVLGGNTNAYARSAGSLPDGSVGHEQYKGHTLGNPGVVPPGGTAMATGLRCFDCHMQHGNATAYRNLGSYSVLNVNPTYLVQSGTGTDVSGAYDVTISNVPAGDLDAAGAYIPQTDGAFGGYYSMQNVSYASHTIGTINNTNRLNNLCAMCHPNFHGAPGAGAVDTGSGATGAGVGGSNTVFTDATGWAAFTRHPTSGVQVGGVVSTSTPGVGGAHGHTKNNGLNSKTGNKVKAAQVNSGDFISASPMCITCHNAHGSNHAFGLRFLAGNVTVTSNDDLENGTGRYPNLCNQCHGQGTSNVETYDANFATGVGGIPAQ